MKKFICILISLLMIAACASCSAAKNSVDKKDIEIIYAGGGDLKLRSEYYAGTLKELEEKSTVIAKVTVLEGSYEKLVEWVDDFGDMVWKHGFTLTPVKIETLYKGDGKTKEGNTDQIKEYYVKSYHKKQPGKAYVQTFEGYKPLVPGEQYILFLKPAEVIGDYETTSLQMGKYVYNDKIKNTVNVLTLTKEDLEILRDAKDDERYWVVAQEVKEKYIK